MTGYAQLRDKIWRIQNLYKIKTKGRQLAHLRFNRVQTIIVDDIHVQLKKGGPIRHFDLKTRQQGVSTFWLLWWLDDTIFNDNVNTGILAHKNESLGYLMEIVALAHRTMPEQYRLPLEGDNRHELRFKYNNSKIFCSLSIRSTALHNLHVSEWCICKDEELAATLGATSESTNISGESTGHGVGNHGFETYTDAKMGRAEDGMIARFFPWFIQEEYRKDLGGMPAPTFTPEEKRIATVAKRDWNIEVTPEQILWMRDMKRKVKGIFRQEYPSTDDDAFLSSGNKFFHFKKILRLAEESRSYFHDRQPVEETDDYVLWEQPDKYSVYVGGADTSDGARDFSILKVINVTKRREAFRYRARVNYKTFYRQLDLWGRRFNKMLLGVERNNHGHAVLLGLEEDCRYPNIFKDDKKTRLGEFVRIGKKTHALPQQKLGWETTGVTRPIMLDHLKSAIEGNEEDDEDHFEPAFTVFDQELLEECVTFEEVDGKFQAIEGSFDDNVIASAIAFQMFLRAERDVKRGGASPGIIALGKRQTET